jgi:hypothetical protein
MRPGRFVCKHFDAMVFTALAEEPRTGDVAVVGAGEYADCSTQLMAWEAVQAKLASYPVKVGLREEGEAGEFDATFFRRQLEDKLRNAAAAADAGYRTTRAWSSTADGHSVAQGAPGGGAAAVWVARMPERSLMGILADAAYSGEW